MSTTPAYGAEQIQVLEGLDAVRKRPGMYIGSTDSAGLQHLLWEIVDNAVDEALAGHADTIDIVMHQDGSVEVTDNGRGIPVDVNSATGLPGVILVMTQLHAGGKFDAEAGGYKVSGGLHGVGASVVNALSRRMDVTVDKGGKRYGISFAYGKPGHFDGDTFTPSVELAALGRSPKGRTGSAVRYWADPDMFPAAELATEATLDRARQTAFLVPGLTLTVADRTENPKAEPEVFRYDGGTVDFCDYLTAGTPLCDVVHIASTHTYETTTKVVRDGTMQVVNVTREMDVDIAVRWAGNYERVVRSFVNIVATGEGGTHLSGFERALTRVVNEQLAEQKILKKDEENVTKEDIAEGLVAVVAVRLPEPEFKGQTKGELNSAEAGPIAYAASAEALRAWFTAKANKVAAKQVLTKIIGAARARIAARQRRDTARRKMALESSSMPAKLADCRTKDVEKAELLIVEGDSAGGSTKSARDPDFQAVMPIRGKILNVLKANEKRMLDNNECAGLISAIGGGVGGAFDLSTIRYGKIVLLMDADVDGSHIRTLLLTLFYRYMNPLLAQGRVYAAQPPLYGIKETGRKPKMHYCLDDAERDQVIAKLKRAGKSYLTPQRYKGLGEMDPEQLQETTLDPAKRTMRRIGLADAERASEVFEMLMGNSPAARREFIEERSAGLSLADLDV